MLGDGGLGAAELGAHGLGQLVRGALTVVEQLQQAPPDRVAENVEGVHDTNI